MKSALFPVVAAISLLAACGEDRVNPPTEPATPLRTADAMQQVEPPGPSSLAGRGPRSFVGVWAANPVWCAHPQGERAPITLTPMRFEAPGRGCDIARIEETGSGYMATLACPASDKVRTERLHMAATGDVMNLTYIDRDMKTVKLARRPGSPRAPDPANPLENMMKKEPEAPASDPS